MTEGKQGLGRTGGRGRASPRLVRQANHGRGENLLLPGGGAPGPRRRSIPPSYQTTGGCGLCALVCFLRPLAVPLVQRLETGADETFAETLSTGGTLARLTWAPSAGPLLTGGLCRSSVWLEEEEETGPLTRPRREWFSSASLSTRALASWKRQLRNSLSSLLLRCHPSISSQRWRSARLLLRSVSAGRWGTGEALPPAEPGSPEPEFTCVTSELLVVAQQPCDHLVGCQLRRDPEHPPALVP